jgi:hypothetical protein
MAENPRADKQTQVAEILLMRESLARLERLLPTAEDYSALVKNAEHAVRRILANYSADDGAILSTEHRYWFRDSYLKYAKLKLVMIKQFGDPEGDDDLGIEVPELDSGKEVPEHSVPDDDQNLTIQDILDQR